MDAQTQRLLDMMTSDSFECLCEGKSSVDSALSFLNFVFDDPSQSHHVDLALDIIDRSKGKIQCYRGRILFFAYSYLGPIVTVSMFTTYVGSSNTIRIYKMISSKESYYNCMQNFCPCRNYFELNKSSPDFILCKHLLAIRFAMILKCIEEIVIDNKEFDAMVMNMTNEY